MKFKDIKNEKLEELNTTEEKLRKDLADSYMQLRMGRLANSSKIAKLRKDIARILTVKKQRSVAVESQKVSK